MSGDNTVKQGQLEIITERLSAVPTSTPRQVRGADGRPDTEPTAPFPSALVLSGGQETAMVAYAMQAIRNLESEMGRDKVMDSAWYANDAFDPSRHADSWMVKRARFEALYANDVSWRPRVYGGIYNESNLTVPLSRRICRQTVARAQNYFFSTDPWFAAEPEGVEDGELADRIGRYLKWKLNKLGAKRGNERTIRHACVRGECVVKTTHLLREQIFDAKVKVLADEQDQPILAADGDYITEGDKWRPQTYFDPQAREELPLPGGEIVLDRDNQTTQPLVPHWVDATVKRRQVLFEGPESHPIYFKDFLCPLTATDVQTAPVVVHLYDKPVIELVNQFIKRGVLSPERVQAAADKREQDEPAAEPAAVSETEAIKETQRAVDLIRALTANTSRPKSGVTLAARPNEEEHDDGLVATYGEKGANDGEPVAEIAEVYLWFDANGDGIQENIMVLIDRNSERPIFYDYVANLTPDGLRPFDVVRINEVENRWYGQGSMELFDTAQQIVDLLVNRWNHSQSRSGRVDFWRPDLTVEGRNDPTLQMNWGGTYTAQPDADPARILTSVYLQDTKFGALQEMFQFFMQMAMNESGVQHANDGQAIGLDSAKLATGIKNIEKAGQEMFAPILSDLEPGLEAILNRQLLVLLANLNKEETFRYFDGDTVINDTIRPEDVRDVKLDVSLLLTRYKGEQQFQQMMQASNVVKDFYALPPEVQARVAQFYQGMIKALDAKLQADEIISPLPPMPPPGMLPPGMPPPGAQAQGGPPMPQQAPGMPPAA